LGIDFSDNFITRIFRGNIENRSSINYDIDRAIEIIDDIDENGGDFRLVITGTFNNANMGGQVTLNFSEERFNDQFRRVIEINGNVYEDITKFDTQYGVQIQGGGTYYGVDSINELFPTGLVHHFLQEVITAQSNSLWVGRTGFDIIADTVFSAPWWTNWMFIDEEVYISGFRMFLERDL